MNIYVPIVIAVATFFWYRKGRLWNFYDSIVKDSIEQITSESLDRKAWEKMAREECDLLGKDLFNSCFRFELEYLRNKINDNKYELWTSSASSDGDRRIIVENKEKYAIYRLKNIFYGNFRYCGLGLFLKSLGYYFLKKKERADTGYTEISLRK